MSVDDLATVSNLDLGSSPWQKISRQMIQEFGTATGDEYEIHMDPEAAKTYGYSDVVAHGYLLLALAPRHYRQLVSFTNRRSALNYGVEDLRFIAPVCAGEEIRYSVLLEEARRKNDGFVYSLRARVEIKGKSKPALAATLIFFAVPED